MKKKCELHVHHITAKSLQRLGFYAVNTGFCIDRGIQVYGLQLWFFGVRIEFHTITGRNPPSSSYW